MLVINALFDAANLLFIHCPCVKTTAVNPYFYSFPFSEIFSFQESNLCIPYVQKHTEKM